MHNYYTYLYNKTVFEVLEEYYGKVKACLFARSATVGRQKFPVHWGGDCFSNYESMAETLRGGLSLCMSGFGYFSHDISGFESQAMPDLYKRWCAFGLMSTHSRLHGNSSYRVPWNFDEESCDVLRHFTKLNGRLMPYIWAQSVKNHNTGIPLMRAMVMEFPENITCRHIDTQYMFGDNLLRAPVLNENGTASWYLPTGCWTDIQSGRTIDGERWYTEKFDYFSMPLFARPNSIIVYGDFKRSFEYDYSENAEAVIYGMENGASASAKVYDSNGATEVFAINAERHGNIIKVRLSGKCGSVKVRSAQGLKIELV